LRWRHKPRIDETPISSGSTVKDRHVEAAKALMLHDRFGLDILPIRNREADHALEPAVWLAPASVERRRLDCIR